MFIPRLNLVEFCKIDSANLIFGTFSPKKTIIIAFGKYFPNFESPPNSTYLYQFFMYRVFFESLMKVKLIQLLSKFLGILVKYVLLSLYYVRSLHWLNSFLQFLWFILLLKTRHQYKLRTIKDNRTISISISAGLIWMMAKNRYGKFIIVCSARTVLVLK